MKESSGINFSVDSITADNFLTIWDLLVGFKTWMIEAKYPMPMEKFPEMKGRRAGQSYGYALYECDLRGPAKLKIGLRGSIRDRALVFLNNVYQGKTLFSVS